MRFPFSILALLAAAPALAEVQPANRSAEGPILRSANGSFTIVETIEAEPEGLDLLPWEAEGEDGPADGSRRPRDEADEAIEEAFEEAEDIARMEAGPD